MQTKKEILSLKIYLRKRRKVIVDILFKLNYITIKIIFVKSEIMNQLSYHVDNRKLLKKGLSLSNKIENDIKDTLKLLKNI